MTSILTRQIIAIVILALISGCTTLETDKPSNVAGKSIQTKDQAAQAKRFFYNKQLRNAVKDIPVKPKESRRNKRVRKNIISCKGSDFALKDLLVEELSLSNQDVRTAASTLSVMGYTVIDLATVGIGRPTPRYTCEDMPLIIMPTLLDENQLTFSNSGRTVANAQNPFPGNNAQGATGDQIINPLRSSNSANLDRLLVFYHPDGQLERDNLFAVVNEQIDSAAPQVYIESMVIEVSREDSRELGVEWQTANLGSHSLLTFGQLDAGSGPTVDFEQNTLREDGVYTFNSGAGVQVRLKALIESGRAQVLSRPSVLALSNRQAVIQILDVLQSPVVSSRINDNGSLTISDYRFEPLLIGITLNLRPRVSADRKWVSMEIDATVEAEVDENSGEVFAPDPTGGRVLLATKDGAASRKVRTFARIPDRTPIIIGGLAAANRENIKGRVPGVGNLPIIGKLFGSTDNEVQERELIIVLTPYVLAEDRISIKTNTAENNHLINNKK